MTEKATLRPSVAFLSRTCGNHPRSWGTSPRVASGMRSSSKRVFTSSTDARWHRVSTCDWDATGIWLMEYAWTWPIWSTREWETATWRTSLCLYARDRMVALAPRQPTQVNEATSDVSTLRLTDFDIESMNPTVIATIGRKYMRDVSHQRLLALMFIEKVSLCRCLGLIVFAQSTHLPAFLLTGQTIKLPSPLSLINCQM